MNRRIDPRSALMLVATIAFTARPVLPSTFSWILTCILAGTLVIALHRRDRLAIHVCLLLAVYSAWNDLNPFKVWPLHALPPLLAFGAVIMSVKGLRPVPWWRPGRIDRWTAALIAATVVVSSTALLAWFLLLKPDVTDLAAMIPATDSIVVLAGMGLGFAIVNAIMEEVIWRGVMMEGLDAAIGPGSATILVQAVSFGIAHTAGFPRGIVGVFMAGIYGAMLGIVRRQSLGMKAPIIAHVFADATIFAILVAFVR